MIKISEKDVPLAKKLGLKVTEKGHPLIWVGEGHLYSPHDYLVAERDFIKLMEAKYGLPFAFKMEGDHFVKEVINSFIAWNERKAKCIWTGSFVYLFGDVREDEILKVLEES